MNLNDNNVASTWPAPSAFPMKDARAGAAAAAAEIRHPMLSNENEKRLDALLADLHQKYSHQPIFLQSVRELAESVVDLLLPVVETETDMDHDDALFYQRAFLAMVEPERVISFRVPWIDDQGKQHFNRGWRVEFSSVLGPYKGGLRFHPSVDEGILKFLGFEQIFKNALTGLPLGAGKGGSDFDPKNKSDAEVCRFCQSFMTELYRYLHPSTDVPAGDIGVGGREIGYMYGQYKRLVNRHGEGVLTGKSLLLGGSPLRPEATGYGLVYMLQLAVQKQLHRPSLDDMRCAVSGSGNVAQYACHKLLQLGAKVVTVSDSNGCLVFPNGMTMDDWNTVMSCKNIHRARLASIASQVTGTYYADRTPWNLVEHNSEGSDVPLLQFDIALPCATQNEIDQDAAERLLSQNGIVGVLEGANLPTTMEAQQVFRRMGIVYVPGKASNAGGVGVSGLEMSQNAQRLTWKPEEVDAKLQEMMTNIYQQMEDAAKSTKGGWGTLEQGANRAGFLKVAYAMKELGWVQ